MLNKLLPRRPSSLSSQGAERSDSPRVSISKEPGSEFEATTSQSAAQNLPSGGLKGAEVELTLTGHSGVPATALLLAYEPAQRLLAVGTRDGRVKLFGADGSEDLLLSAGRDPCKYLEFIYNQNALVHISTTNEIKVFDVNDRELAASLQWASCVTAFTVAQGTMFMYIGDESGMVSVVQYLPEEGILSVTPYSVPSHLTLRGLVESGSTDGGLVVAILPQPGAVHNRILIAYSIGLVVLWGLYEEQPLLVRGGSKNQHSKIKGPSAGRTSLLLALDDEDDPQEISNACWASISGKLLAVGYLNGDIGLWHIPNPFSSKKAEGDPWSPLQLVKLAPSEQRLPVSSINFAASGQTSGRLYVLGGGDCQHPLKITVLAVAEEEPCKLPAQTELPWFGPVGDFRLLRDTEDVYGSASGIAVLDSSGQLRIYDENTIAGAIHPDKISVSDLQPAPVHLQLSESSITTAKAFLFTETDMAFCIVPKVLKDNSAISSSRGLKFGSGHPGGHTGGTSTYYLSGHKDGTVQLWDATIPGFHFVCLIPQNLEKEEEEGQVYPPVSALDFCPTSGLLVVAHEKGLVRFYILSEQKRDYCKRVIKADMTVDTGSVASHDAGFQIISDVVLHQATVTRIRLATAVGLVALGDASGVVSLVNLKTMSVLYLNRPMPVPSSLDLSVVPSALSGTPSGSPRSNVNLSTPRPDFAAFVTNTKSALFVVSEKLRYEFHLGDSKVIAAKAEPTDINSFFLDVAGLCISSPASELPLPWISNPAANNTGGTTENAMDAEQTGDATGSLPALTSGESADRGEAPEEAAENLPATPKAGTDSGAVLSGLSEPVFLLLCTEKQLVMFNITAMPSGRFNYLTKIDVPGPCIRAFTLGVKDVLPPGLLLVYQSGDLEVRSLPDLTVVTKTSITECLGWQLEVNDANLKTLVCTADGHLSMVVFSDTDGSAEVVQMSVLTNIPSQQRCSAEPESPQGSGVEAEEPEGTGVVSSERKKPKVFKAFKSRLRGMAKEAKFVVATVQSNLPSEVTKALKKGTKVVSSIGNTVSSSLPTKSLSLPRKSKIWLRMSSEKPVLRSSSDLQVLFLKPVGSAEELDIDDIDIDDVGSDDFRSTPAVDVTDRRASPKDLKKKASFSGERSSIGESVDKLSMREVSERSKLFEGGSSSGGSSFTPQVRSAAEIRAKYGHPSASDIGGAAREARHKLAERGERLQAVQDKTQDLEAGAANFASMAEELAKKMEGKKWWEL